MFGLGSSSFLFTMRFCVLVYCLGHLIWGKLSIMMHYVTVVWVVTALCSLEVFAVRGGVLDLMMGFCR